MNPAPLRQSEASAWLTHWRPPFQLGLRDASRARSVPERTLSFRIVADTVPALDDARLQLPARPKTSWRPATTPARVAAPIPDDHGRRRRAAIAKHSSRGAPTQSLRYLQRPVRPVARR